MNRATQIYIMAAHASKRAKEDDQQKKEKVQEEKEASKRLKEDTEKKKKKDKFVEMMQNARISRMSFLKGSAPHTYFDNPYFTNLHHGCPCQQES